MLRTCWGSGWTRSSWFGQRCQSLEAGCKINQQIWLYLVCNRCLCIFKQLLSSRRQAKASIKTFESRFEAQLTRFKAHGSGSIPDSLLALMRLSHDDIEDSQRLSILAASVHDVSLDNTDASAADIMSKVQYSSIAVVLRQCDHTGTKRRHDDGSSLNSNYANGRNETVAVDADVVVLLERNSLLLNRLH